MNDLFSIRPIRGAVPCDRCLDQFISTRHQLHQQIKRWQGDYMQMKAENERLRVRNAELVEAEIKLRQAVEQQRQQAISKQEGAAS